MLLSHFTTKTEFWFQIPSFLHSLTHSSAGGRLPSHSETPLACTNPDLHTFGMNQRTASSAQGCVSSLNPADFMRKALAFKAASFCKEARGSTASTEQQHPAEIPHASLQPLQTRCRLQGFHGRAAVVEQIMAGQDALPSF